MRKVFKTKRFVRWMKKTELSDQDLLDAVKEMDDGLIDADLGGGVLKKRVALPGKGKSGGVRTLVATNKEDRWFFVFGFEKKVKANISNKELDALQLLADDLLQLSPAALEKAVEAKELSEVHNNGEE